MDDGAWYPSVTTPDELRQAIEWKWAAGGADGIDVVFAPEGADTLGHPILCTPEFVTGPHLAALREEVQQGKKINDLFLWSRLTVGGLVALPGELRSIAPRNIHLRNSGCALEIAWVLSRDVPIRAVRIESETMDSNVCACLMNSLWKNTVTEVFYIEGCALDSTAMSTLGKALSSNETLRYLGVDGCILTYDAVSVLEEMLRQNPCLETMSIRNAIAPADAGSTLARVWEETGRKKGEFRFTLACPPPAAGSH